MLFALPLIILGLWLPNMLHPESFELEGTSPLFSLINENISVLAGQIIAICFLVLTAMVLNSIINQNSMFDRNTFLPALFYLVLMSSMSKSQLLSPIVISNLFLVLAFRRLFMIYRQVPCKREIFDASLFILIGCLFYFPSIILFPIVWVALSVLRPFVWREWMIPSLAILMVMVYLSVVLFLTDSLTNWRIYVNVFYGQYQNLDVDLHWSMYVAFGLLILSVNFSGFYLSKMSRNSSIRFRKLSTFFLFIISLYVIQLLVEKLILKNEVYMLQGAIPLSILLTFYFQNAKRNWLAESIFYAMLGIVVVNIYWI